MRLNGTRRSLPTWFVRAPEAGRFVHGGGEAKRPDAAGRLVGAERQWQANFGGGERDDQVGIQISQLGGPQNRPSAPLASPRMIKLDLRVRRWVLQHEGKYWLPMSRHCGTHLGLARAAAASLAGGGAKKGAPSRLPPWRGPAPTCNRMRPPRARASGGACAKGAFKSNSRAKCAWLVFVGSEGSRFISLPREESRRAAPLFAPAKLLERADLSQGSGKWAKWAQVSGGGLRESCRRGEKGGQCFWARRSVGWLALGRL